MIVPLKVLAILMIIGNVISAIWFNVPFDLNNAYWWFALYAFILALLAAGLVRWIAFLTHSIFLLLVSNAIPLGQIYAVHHGASFTHSQFLPTGKFFSRPSDLGVELSVSKDGDVWGTVFNRTDSLVKIAWVKCSLGYESGKRVNITSDQSVSGELGNAFIIDGYPRKVKLVHRNDIELYKVNPNLTSCEISRTRTFPHENLPVTVKTVKTGLGVLPVISITNNGTTPLNNMIGICKTNEGKLFQSRPIEVETILARDNPDLEPGQTRFYNLEKNIDFLVSCKIISENIKEE